MAAAHGIKNSRYFDVQLAAPSTALRQLVGTCWNTEHAMKGLDVTLVLQSNPAWHPA
jgi:hypothetical protein